MTARRALPDAVAACALAALIFVAFGHAFLNYDTFYALVWGDDLAHGRTPQYDLPVHPTTHPLAVALGALVSPLGDAGEDALLAIGFLALGALAVGLFRLGAELYAWPIGLLAAAIFLTRVPVLNFGVRGYVDLWTLALVVWAAVLEARRPQRGVAVLVLLGLAGLLRPEAWLIAAAYLAWLAPALPRERLLRLAGLAAAAPLVWMLSDLLITGDPLWSLHGTTDVARELERRTGLANVHVGARRLGEILRAPELVASLVGVGIAAAWLRRRSAIPFALLALNGIAFAGFAIAGLSLLGRYLFLAAAMLALFAALAALGWTTGASDAGGPPRGPWRIAGLALIFAFGLFAPTQANRLSDLRADIAARDRIQADLLDLVRSDAAEAALVRCGTLYVPNHRPVPALAYWTQTRPRQIVSAQLERPARDGLFLAPADDEVERLSVLDPKDPKRLNAEVPARYRLAARNRSWLLYRGC